MYIIFIHIVYLQYIFYNYLLLITGKKYTELRGISLDDMTYNIIINIQKYHWKS